ncbi:putative defense protein [Armadillidium vulgare]|nr:putative defense protein [Armadillidium vulgare]
MKMCTKLLMLFVGISLLCHFGNVNGYSMGAPDVACESMTPGHGQTVRTDVPPYRLKPNVTSVFNGEKLLLTLDSQDKPLKGFFIQARQNEDDGKPIGQFLLIKDDEHHLVNCKSGINNAVTHKSPDEKTSVMIQWQAPDNFEGDIYFQSERFRFTGLTLRFLSSIMLINVLVYKL